MKTTSSEPMQRFIREYAFHGLLVATLLAVSLAGCGSERVIYVTGHTDVNPELPAAPEEYRACLRRGFEQEERDEPWASEMEARFGDNLDKAVNDLQRIHRSAPDLPQVEASVDSIECRSLTCHLSVSVKPDAASADMLMEMLHHSYPSIHRSWFVLRQEEPHGFDIFFARYKGTQDPCGRALGLPFEEDGRSTRMRREKRLERAELKQSRQDLVVKPETEEERRACNRAGFELEQRDDGWASDIEESFAQRYQRALANHLELLPDEFRAEVEGLVNATVEKLECREQTCHLVMTANTREQFMHLPEVIEMALIPDIRGFMSNMPSGETKTVDLYLFRHSSSPDLCSRAIDRKAWP